MSIIKKRLCPSWLTCPHREWVIREFGFSPGYGVNFPECMHHRVHNTIEGECDRRMSKILRFPESCQNACLEVEVEDEESSVSELADMQSD